MIVCRLIMIVYEWPAPTIIYKYNLVTQFVTSHQFVICNYCVINYVSVVIWIGPCKRFSGKHIIIFLNMKKKENKFICSCYRLKSPRNQGGWPNALPRVTFHHNLYLIKK